MKLAILLTSDIFSEDVRTVYQISKEALSQGHSVSIFLMDDGIYNLKKIKELRNEGGEISLCLCAHNAMQREVPKEEGILFGSQYDWAQTVHEADKVLSFG